MYLVTGGAGFIGSHIAEALVKQGKKVRILDNFSKGRMENLKGILDKIQLIKGDIRSKPDVRHAVKGVKYIFHEAALCSVPKSLDNPGEFNEVNVTGTLNLLMAAREYDIKRFVFASSSSVYGNDKTFPKKEFFFPQPISPYAANKLTGEYYCRVFWESYRLPTVVLRYFNVFGPRQRLDDQYAVVIPKFISSLLNNQKPPVHGDGRQSRDFTYVVNVVRANLIAIKARPHSFGKVFNVACNNAYTILDLIKILNKLMGKNIKPAFLPSRKGDIKHSWADISLANKHLGYKPLVGFEEGLKQTIEYFK
ncbi:MAG: SDR family oxidoreductase [Planctomycetes bacterium]|nr:SDR family oxidoreductase [Planctomycetota bacterium]